MPSRPLVRIAFLAVLLIAGAGIVAASPGTPRLVRPRAGAVMGSGLARVAAVEPGREVTVWVFFTDKGVRDVAGYARALDATERTWSARVGDRRALAHAPADFTDLPVHAPYVRRLRGDGFAVRRTSRWLNAASVRTPAGRLAALEALPFVRFVQPVLVRRGGEPFPDAGDRVEPPAVLGTAAAPDSALEAWFYGPSLNQLKQVQGLALHRLGYTGAGVRVMILDTGFRKSHPAFQTCTNLVAEHDFVNGDGNVQNEGSDPASAEYHGTGCWGVLGGYAPGALVGPAWAAEFVLAKTEDVLQEVRAEEDNYVAALEWGDSLGVEVTSASLAYFDFDDGFTYTVADLDGNTPVITRAIDLAVAKGIACVNAMGNAGPNPSTLFSPADADSVIAVGAVDSLGTVASFSSRGPTGDGRVKPEIVARGVNTYWARAWTDGYGPASGTSLSTPVVGGIVALIKEAHPDWDGATIREAIMATGSHAGTPDNNTGWGLLRGLDVIDNAGAVPEPPRMTLPFTLVAPADGAVTGSMHPTLTWCASIAARPGDAADYTVFLKRGSVVDTLAAGPDTSLVVPFALAAGDSIRWWVHAVGELGYVRKSMDARAFSVSTTLAAEPVPDATALRLLGARPNPARGAARVFFAAPAGEPVRLEIVAATGRLVRRFDLLGRGSEDAVEWDGRDAHGALTPPGMYFYRVTGRSGVASGKLVRIP